MLERRRRPRLGPVYAIALFAAVLGGGLLTGCATPSGIGDSLGVSPHENWTSMETEHFQLTYPAELREAALKSANYLEEAHESLSKRLRWEADSKVHVLILDNEDAANGLTSPAGRFGMVFYVTPPDNWFSTYYYDDWLRLLAIHEYAHFLNMDPTTDYSKVLRVLFGDVTLPNTAWPSWMLEGLAVYMETRLTRSGRGRSPYWNTILRSAVEGGVLDSDSFVTLDRINGDNPYFPGGETAYLFGYHLMNRIAMTGPQFEENLGEMSIRSSRRVPFLINGNLKNITQKDFYDIWAEWTEDTRKRAEAELALIRSKPVTRANRLTQGGRTTLGSAFSPDGRWLAYTQDSNDRRMSLWIRDLKTGETRVAESKIFGAGASFTPDSRFVVASSLRRSTNYTLYSDLRAYDAETGQGRWLSEGLRARDPDVSRDGNFVVFTRTERARTGIAIAPLIREEGTLRLGEVRTVYSARPFEAAYTPKFSADGKKVYFSLHPVGQTSENLMELDVASGATRELVANGAFNRFPAVHPSGDVYFVSDASGVDNIHVLSQGKPVAVTNLTTGAWFPSFDASGKLHAGLFSHTGWDLAELEPAPGLVEAPRLPPLPAPQADAESAPHRIEKEYESTDYSAMPSLLPRQWTPLLFVGPRGAVFGGQVLGFDSVDLHRYLLSGSYDTEVGEPDYLVHYANRSLGPTLSLTADVRTSSTSVRLSDLSLASYTRKLKYAATLSYPFRWTFSTLTASTSLNAERSILYMPDASTGAFGSVASTRYVPSLDGILTFSNTESSPLAVTAEKGRITQFGARVYQDSGLTPGGSTWKGFFKDSEYIRLTEHSVLIPSFKASWTSRLSGYSTANVEVDGRTTGDPFELLPADSLDQLAIRGYPSQAFFARSAQALALDYRFPVIRVFRGWGTNPAYLHQLTGFVFGETTYFPQGAAGGVSLPSFGGGLKLSAEFFLHVPTVFTLEYHHGLRPEYGGIGELFFTANLGGFSF